MDRRGRRILRRPTTRWRSSERTFGHWNTKLGRSPLTPSIPIAHNGNGDFYIVSLRESDFGSILYAFHETCDPMDDSLDGAIVLAPSFSEWTASFRPKQKRTSTPDWTQFAKRNSKRFSTRSHHGGSFGRIEKRKPFERVFHECDPGSCSGLRDDPFGFEMGAKF